MLSRLTISNYALIEHLDFVPGPGLSIITGETGAGKSVMLGALGLLLGERADMKVIADESRKAVVEASFTDLDDATDSRLKTIDPEWDGKELIIRREILPSGRSRAFVNDSPATLSNLAEITRGLLDIHSQNSNSILSEQRTQLSLIDAIAHNEELMGRYEKDFREYASLRVEIRKRKDENSKLREHAEITAFRLGQLDKLKPKAGELNKIEAQHESLSNSEDLKEALITAKRALEDGLDGGAINKIEEAASAVSDVDFSLWEETDSQINPRLHNCVVELKDISETIESAINLLDCDPATLERLSKRMHDYYSALKAFRVETDEELENLHLELKRQYSRIENGSDTEELEKKAREKAAVLKKEASEISAKRKEASKILQREIEEEARKLGLSNLRFEIKLTETKLNKTGGDNVEFMASFNKNSALAPVGEIASGGEMARLMLAVKRITASHLSLPTIIFDEIDTGVSGNIADKMGEMMNEMGSMMQILTITHLPQVAVKGERHFKVYKRDTDEKTISSIMLLTDQQREDEIGRMLSGSEIDEAARTNARSLLNKKAGTR